MTAYAAETVGLSNVKRHALHAWVSMSASSLQEFPVPGEASTLFLMCDSGVHWYRVLVPLQRLGAECLMPTGTMGGCVN